jgi:hypothetical protein
MFKAQNTLNVWNKTKVHNLYWGKISGRWDPASDSTPQLVIHNHYKDHIIATWLPTIKESTTYCVIDLWWWNDIRDDVRCWSMLVLIIFLVNCANCTIGYVLNQNRFWLSILQTNQYIQHKKKIIWPLIAIYNQNIHHKDKYLWNTSRCC